MLVSTGTAGQSVETDNSGNTLINPSTYTTIMSSDADTSATIITQKFGDDTGGIAGIRCNSGAMEFQDSGGAWTGLGGAALPQALDTSDKPSFAGVTLTAQSEVTTLNNTSADLTIKTTTSGDINLDAYSKIVVISKTVDTSSNVITQKFGDDTGGIAGIRCNNGAMEAQNSGGAWAAFPAAGGGGGGTFYYTKYAQGSVFSFVGGNTTRMKYNSLYYDPQSYVTTGASWQFQPPVGSFNWVTASIRFADSNNWTADTDWEMGLYTYDNQTLRAQQIIGARMQATVAPFAPYGMFSHFYYVTHANDYLYLEFTSDISGNVATTAGYNNFNAMTYIPA